MNDNRDRSVAVDFDGTVVEFAYPLIGKPVPHAIECLHFLRKKGIGIILWTCRTGKGLEEAAGYMTKAGIPLLGVNSRPEEPGWPAGNKVFASVYIDDASAGCPLRPSPGRPVVDWPKVMVELDRVFPGEGFAKFSKRLVGDEDYTI